MRSLLSLRGNLGKLALKSAGALWPPNLVVVSRNARDSRRDEPWSNFVARTGDPSATVREALELALHWLATSQDRVGTGGVGSYEFYGWTPGFPEVTGYILVGIRLEEHDLTRQFGDQYRSYRQHVAMLVPFPGRGSSEESYREKDVDGRDGARP